MVGQRPSTAGQRPSLNSELLHFFVVILAVENVPLLAAFKDGALLAFNLLAGRLVYPRLLHEQFFQDLAGFQPDRVAVFNKVYLRQFGQRVADDVGNFIHFIAAESHGSSRELRDENKETKGYHAGPGPSGGRSSAAWDGLVAEGKFRSRRRSSLSRTAGVCRCGTESSDSASTRWAEARSVARRECSP